MLCCKEMSYRKNLMNDWPGLIHLIAATLPWSIWTFRATLMFLLSFKKCNYSWQVIKAACQVPIFPIFYLHVGFWCHAAASTMRGDISDCAEEPHGKETVSVLEERIRRSYVHLFWPSSESSFIWSGVLVVLGLQNILYHVCSHCVFVYTVISVQGYPCVCESMQGYVTAESFHMY